MNWKGENNIRYNANDLLFLNPDAGDFRRDPASQAIDKGDDSYAFNAGIDENGTDLDGSPRFSGSSIDIGAYESNSDSFSLRRYYTQSHKAVMEWTPIPGAVKYIFKVSKDGGNTWITYDKNFTDPIKMVNGIYPGKSYPFRVYGVDASGKILENYKERVIEPVGLVVADKPYVVGKPKKVTVQIADPSTVEIRWYKITNSGLVEIPSAYNQTTYASPDGLYELKVIATGLEGTNAKGFTAEVNVGRPDKTIEFGNQSADGSAVTARWTMLEGAASYTVKLSRDGGQTWITKKKDVSTNSVRLMMVADGNMFRVTAFDADGKQLKSIALGTYKAAPNQDVPLLFADVNDAATAATLVWLPVTDAVTYKIRVSRDGGTTWIDKAKDIEGTSKALENIKTGYAFRVYGYDANGSRLAKYHQATFNGAFNAIVDDAFADLFAEDDEFFCEF